MRRIKTPSNHWKAIIIGETKLCAQCGELLLDNRWNISCVVSDDPIVINWAQKNALPILPTSKLSSIQESNYYLFSIINPSIIPQTLLENENVLLAVNYHDSLLPKYAGTNSTTWAILNNETSHGVTLHKINTGIDNGDIIAQTTIDIAKDETTISLNLKCSEALLTLFSEVIAKIETGSLTYSPQNLQDRSYYGVKKIPNNYGIINGISNPDELYKLTRALSFGNGYNNPIASTKIFLDDKFYLLEDFNAALVNSKSNLRSNAILFDTVKDIYGNKIKLKITYKDILTPYVLSNDDLDCLSSVKAQERKNRKQILDILTNSEANIKILDHVQSEQDTKHYLEKFETPNQIKDVTALTLIYIVLARFFYHTKFIISLYVADATIAPTLNNLIGKRNFVCIDTESLNKGFVQLENYLTQLAQNNSYILTKDFGYRYNLDLQTDIAITLGKIAQPDKHSIIIEIDDGNITIKGNAAYQLEINSIVAALKPLTAKDIPTEIASENLAKINLLSSAQYNQIVYEWNKTDKEYSHEKTIHELFEEQALKHPNNIAVAYKDSRLTYQELNQKANQLAHYLREQYAIKPNNLVALCLDRNEFIFIAILGVLKAGGAYVPIDPKYPDERIGYILEDTKTKVVLTNDLHLPRLQQLIKNKTINSDVIAINANNTHAILAKQNNLNPLNHTSSKNLIYVIYTSGTTGNPKGVLIEHGSIVNYSQYLITENKLTATSSGAQYAGFGFDAVVCESYPILLSGGTLYIIEDNEKLSPTKVNEFFLMHNINYAFLPTKFAELFFLLKNNSIANLVVAGEKLEKFVKQPYHVINAYGPTEASVHTTSFIVDRAYNNIPIGKPINNVKCYVVDNNLQILPLGATGELLIGGKSLARGYLNRHKLTAEKFIANPFQTAEEKSQNKNSRLYKTGDLVRMLPDGNLEFIGRNDSQVKIRGFRVELGEIEKQLLNFPGVRQAVVIVKEQVFKNIKDKSILAYYVADKKLDEVKMYKYLATKLLDYMLPSSLMFLEKLPLTLNGKLDQKALPKFQFTISSNYVSPKTKLQNQILKTWSEVLNLPQESIGIKDSFFKLGGNSILAIILATKLHETKACQNIKVVDIYKYPTIEQLSKAQDAVNSDTNISISGKEKLETEIAVIAISGAFSGCENTDQYWNLIQSGTEGIKTYTLEEGKELGIIDEILHDPNFVPTSGHVPNIDKFDAVFWNLLPNETKLLDPQIRKFLEHCWYVLEESGYAEQREKINIGVFAGSGNSNYLSRAKKNSDNKLNIRDLDDLNAKDILATKTSYLLGLTGISSNINTTCSTGLVTVVEACQSLASGYCDMAIAGGVSLLLPEEIGHVYQDGLIYSKDGHCRVFDHEASGIIHGSGVGVVLLKRLADARKDKNHIMAIIKGYAANNDGNRKIGFTAPSVVGQKECILKAQKMAGITANSIGYIECHGTGTRLGDPIEICALNEAFAANSNNKTNLAHKCFLGSVKANIGHADAAAGIAGLIKVCKMLEQQIIPKQINYAIPNPELYLENTNFVITTATTAWKKINNKPRTAAISSFGIGGTNAHVIVSEYLPKTEEHAKASVATTNKHILLLSAKNQASLDGYKNQFINYLSHTKDDIGNIAYTLQLKREHFTHRLAVVADSIKDAITKLNSTTNIDQITNITPQHNIIFMFPGQGNQYANMSLDLYTHDQDYKILVDDCIKLVNQNTKIKFEEILFPALFGNNTPIYDINQTEWAQTAIFIVEYSLAKLLEKLHISPVGYIGHSIGEYVAATLAQVFSLEDAIKLVLERSKLMQAMPKGSMLSMQASVAEVKEIVVNNYCEIATINSPKNCVAAGSEEAIQNLKSELVRMNIPCVILNVSHAYHSHFMADAARKFTYRFRQIKLSYPKINFISNVTGCFIDRSDAINPEYWAKHIRSTVLLSDGIKTICESYDNPFFIEVGPGKSLISFIKHHHATNYNVAQLLNSFKENQNSLLDIASKEALLAKLWLNGLTINFAPYHNDKNRIVKLPSYHFDNSSYWVNPIKDTTIKHVIALKNQDTAENFNNLLPIKCKVIEQNLSDKHYDIARIFLDVLGIEKISINDNLSTLGVDSLASVGLVAKLQKSYQISMDEFLKFQSIDKIAKFAPFIKDNFKVKLEKIKLLYAKQAMYLANDVEQMLAKQAKYLLEIKNIIFNPQQKPIHNVLLTGATGHVGCNILYQLLHQTQYKIYLPIRAKSKAEAVKKINNKFNYYFDTDLNTYNARVVILVADLERSDLGLSLEQHQELVTNIDSIIHSAALVKHYGTYQEAYNANVQSTINLLELSKLTATKDFHYISTIGVLAQDGYIPNCSYFIFHEDEDAGVLVNRNNTYVKTKYEAEVLVTKYREFGITSSIYRLGNVAMHATNYRHQENIEDNAFFIHFKTILKLGMLPKEMTECEISPVDYTAAAIVKLFAEANLSNQTYHVFNPNVYHLEKIFMAKNIPIKICSINEFIDNILIAVNAGHGSDYTKQIELFMLHHKWLQDINTDNVTRIKILQDKTYNILLKLGFSWPEITEQMWSGILQRV
ncbi:MAG: amino acid adenylation domain-containing protein [Gammaproteobacteria bacterium]|nr:amino acid adenylation domain-containing protein [Gammaproteobacteria bacterium]